MKLALAAALVLVPVCAHAHHGGEVDLIRQAGVAIDLGWPIIATVVAGFGAIVRDWLRGRKDK